MYIFALISLVCTTTTFHKKWDELVLNFYKISLHEKTSIVFLFKLASDSNVNVSIDQEMLNVKYKRLSCHKFMASN